MYWLLYNKFKLSLKVLKEPIHMVQIYRNRVNSNKYVFYSDFAMINFWVTQIRSWVTEVSEDKRKEDAEM